MASTSLVDVWNRALTLVGEAPIRDIADQGPGATAIRAIYDHLRTTTLQAALWKFAVELQELPRNMNPPRFGWRYSYSLPAQPNKIIRTIGLFETFEATVPLREFDQASGTIHTDAETVYLRYVADVEDVNRMSPMFRELLAMEIATGIALSRTSSLSVRNQLLQLLPDVRTRAIAVDALEDSIQQSLNEYSWLVARSHAAL